MQPTHTSSQQHSNGHVATHNSSSHRAQRKNVISCVTVGDSDGEASPSRHTHAHLYHHLPQHPQHQQTTQLIKHEPQQQHHVSRLISCKCRPDILDRLTGDFIIDLTTCNRFEQEICSPMRTEHCCVLKNHGSKEYPLDRSERYFFCKQIFSLGKACSFTKRIFRLISRIVYIRSSSSSSSGYSSQSQKKRLLAKVQSECNMVNIATKPEPGVEYLAPHPCHAPACKEPPTYQVNYRILMSHIYQSDRLFS